MDNGADSQLVFYSDGKDMKMNMQQFAASAISAEYMCQVPAIIKITMDFASETTVNVFTSVFCISTVGMSFFFHLVINDGSLLSHEG